ncbi:tRNA (5-methylaminomethyl-2-thiouridine)(34)-methyltransferase MnmD [Neolewinella aurantiaca]|uniref:tRNA (5-methylaminomethyl-2-thiouridine)(34)-methyltransferase MnmD n=1 Tax=Neolewinella aurantiaca TaxID=2602767 RepID=A0A5C7FJS9_9BACT|nr:tRNA (5-methylaminomethyl-2-thiouridine)(34)-methyltransferase MnmD [Neolewinella aurantiaca]TXF91536.1 tRNA (5-methylaminomethyl-2-thiouridine)(34)-methyltransferase MnmD [Neolewinella aurantiaca]
MINELVLTTDGSHTLRSQQFGVEYHSVHGAVQESMHVFINTGLLPLLERGDKEVRILEMGFGTGLNALLVRQIAQQRPDINFVYHTYEQYPVSPVEVAALNYPGQIGVAANVFFELHDCGWNDSIALDPNFTFCKRRADYLTDTDRPYAPGAVDLIFYDAFAPSSQPEFWEPEGLAVSYAALSPGGVLVTYCAKGQFKRNLRSVGFTVVPMPGPPGKREMTKGIVEA